MNIKLKRKLSFILLCVFCLSSFGFSTYASEHWAQDIANKLSEKGIVNGYDDGSFGLDNNILRAEFVSIINRAFGFSSVSGENFSDVPEDKWYFNDMHIGKTQGYVTGDDLGKSNPENSITRAEASVILARILKLDTTVTVSDIKDISSIPNWAKGHICALVKEGIISGYPDGEFKAENILTRGEGFTLINKIIDLKQPEKEPEVTQPQTPSTSGSSMGNLQVNSGTSSGGFGGGGGGGGGNTAPLLQIVGTPVLRYNSDNGYLISWADCLGAQSYSVKLRFADENSGMVVVPQTNNLSIDVLDLCRQYSSARDNARESIYISVKGNAMPGWMDANSYSDEVMVTVDFESVDAPFLSARYGKANNIRRAIIDWNDIPNVSGFDVKLLVDGIEKTQGVDYVYDSSKNEVLIADLSILNDNSYLEVTALSSNPSVYKNSQVVKEKIEFSDDGLKQDGSEEYPWIITDSEQFAQIGKDGSKYLLSHNYVIYKDITVTKPVGSDTKQFTGSITGKKNGTEYKPVVTLNITEGATKESSGFVANLKGGTISNIEFCGNITLDYIMHSGNSNPRGVAAVCGVMDGGIISDIINRANITNGASGSWAGNANDNTVTGGIVGHTTNSGTDIIKNCINYGNVNGKRFLGGICAVGYGVTITNCHNYGTIGNSTNSGQVGGISSHIKGGSVIGCSNFGKIISYKQLAGGIVGKADADTYEVFIKECFNKGTIEGNTQLGGIVGLVQKQNGVKTTVSDCFDIADNNSIGKIGSIVGELGRSNYTNDLDLLNCYSTRSIPVLYKSNNAGNVITTTIDEKITNYFLGESDSLYAKATDSDGLKNLLTNDISFDSSKWHILSDYDYPQLKNNPYTKTVETTPEITNFSKVYSQGNLTFNWQLPALATEVKVTVKNNSQIKILEENVSLPLNALTTYTLENVLEGEWYEITLEVLFDDKESYIQTFEAQAQ